MIIANEIAGCASDDLGELRPGQGDACSTWPRWRSRCAPRPRPESGRLHDWFAAISRRDDRRDNGGSVAMTDRPGPVQRNLGRRCRGSERRQVGAKDRDSLP